MNDWEKVGRRKRSGILAPLFSVYSNRSAGIGDFADLALLADWCRKTGNSILQLLPINEMGGGFCPYEAISSFALEPVYARVEGARAHPPPAVGDSAPRRADWRVKAAKLEALRGKFLRSGGRDGKKTEAFKDDSAWWIDDFCLFKTLKAHFGGQPWHLWPGPFRDRDPHALRAFRESHRAELDFEAWLQRLLFDQFRETRSRTAEKGVLLMGDLPVLIGRDSADVWAHPELFKPDLVAGAPPDVFSAKGQRWGNPGMPTFNWEAIAAADYRYLRERTGCAGRLYDILRIDHVVGLFRIWSIPLEDPPENRGANGFFDPPDQAAWEEHGRKILSVMTESTAALLCAEDLGVIPDACPRTLQALEIPGMEIQRWAKDWHGSRNFLPPEEYRPLSVAALSTHDTSNWNAWWENESTPEERRDLWGRLELEGPVRDKADPGVTAAALGFILKARSVFSIQLVFDWLNLAGIFGADQARIRVNRPGTVGPENWSAALPLPLEELLKDPVCGKIKKLVEGSGRE